MNGPLGQYLLAVHDTNRAVGTEQLCEGLGWPRARSVYRWHARLGEQLIYFPNVALGALGFTHLHLFIDDPDPSWEGFRYAIRGLWVVTVPGRRTLYLHCVVPNAHSDHVRAYLAEVSEHQHITSITTTDGWQALGVPRALPGDTVDAVDLLAVHPFILPALFEGIETRKSYPALWEAICDRLGERVWEYLPRFTRRLQRNGKEYITDTFRVLSDAHLVKQHMIRYEPLRADALELVLVINAEPEDVLAAFRGAAAIELYPAGDATLVHLHAPHASLTNLFSATLNLPVTRLWFVDRTTNDRQPVNTRFTYETLFDPATRTWVIP